MSADNDYLKHQYGPVVWCQCEDKTRACRKTFAPFIRSRGLEYVDEYVEGYRESFAHLLRQVGNGLDV